MKNAVLAKKKKKKQLIIERRELLEKFGTEEMFANSTPKLSQET